MNDQTPKIGIALSGGGSRAMAFHLGCLRTLHRLGILDRALVLSTVSGGSVIGAMYAVHDGSFAEFEDAVREVLRAGFFRPALRTAFTTAEGPRAVICSVAILLTWLWLTPFRLVAKALSLTRLSGGKKRPGFAPEPWMPRQFATRTTILRRTFDSTLFKGRTLGSLKRDRPKLITMAAELRTGSAFYFSKQGAGCWRFGKTDPSDVLVAHAVAASAAYPLLLPALDEFLPFRKRDGSMATERVTLTDGGIYDNLGLSSLWPDRTPEISIAVEPVDTIIACNAGYGLRLGNPRLTFHARMAAAFGCVQGRAQNASIKRLHDLKDSGRLKSFLTPSLDQDDEKLEFPPPDLIRRSAVADYPTDFFGMSSEWIEKLSKRGEQITLAVIHQHAPNLLLTVLDDSEPSRETCVDCSS